MLPVDIADVDCYHEESSQCQHHHCRQCIEQQAPPAGKELDRLRQRFEHAEFVIRAGDGNGSGRDDRWGRGRGPGVPGGVIHNYNYSGVARRRGRAQHQARHVASSIEVLGGTASTAAHVQLDYTYPAKKNVYHDAIHTLRLCMQLTSYL